MNFIVFLLCMMFSTKESKVNIHFRLSLLSYTELSHKIQQKTCAIGNWKFFSDTWKYWKILTENTEKKKLKPDLPDRYIFLCTFCSKFGWYMIYLQFTNI